MKLCIAVSTLVLAAGSSAVAGEKALMHCFAYTPIAEATQAEWDAFEKASNDMPKMIPGITRIWVGKLARPLNIVSGSDAADRKRVAAGEKDVAGKLVLQKREYGMCIEMKDEETLKTYPKHAYHKVWSEAYAKVRVAGTTTFDIVAK